MARSAMWFGVGVAVGNWLVEVACSNPPCPFLDVGESRTAVEWYLGTSGEYIAIGGGMLWRRVIRGRRRRCRSRGC